MTSCKAFCTTTLTLVACRNITKGKLVRVTASCSAPMMIPLSIRTADIYISVRSSAFQRLVALTQWIEIKWYVQTFLDASGDVCRVVRRLRLNCKGVKPYPHPLTVVSPERIFQGANTAKVYPAEFNAIRKYLEVVLDFSISRL